MTSEPIDGEFVEERAVVPLRAQPLTRSPFGTDDPVAIVERVAAIATPLADFIKARGMATRISGREYVLAEGWSFMGAMLGVSPVATRVSELRGADGDLVGFEAHVELRMRDGSLVGGAVAECSRSEKNWADRDDFALKSMAQTRATGKAYRLAFGFVMKAAGYEATPAEEMGVEPAQTRVGGRQPTPPIPREAPATTGEFEAFLGWAKDEHQMGVEAVCRALEIGVERFERLSANDLERAKAKITAGGPDA